MSADFTDALTRLKPRHAIAVGKAFPGGVPVIFKVPEIVEPLEESETGGDSKPEEDHGSE